MYYLNVTKIIYRLMMPRSSIKCDRLDWKSSSTSPTLKMRRRTMVHQCGACHRTSYAKVRKSAKVNKRNLSERTRIFSVYLLPLPVLGLMCIYIYICVCVCVCVCVCMQALLFIRWGFDGDFYSLWVMPLRGVDGELSSQRYGS